MAERVGEGFLEMGRGALEFSDRGWESDQKGHQKVRSTVPGEVRDTGVTVGIFSWVYKE